MPQPLVPPTNSQPADSGHGAASNPPVEYRSIEGFPGYRVGDDGSVWSRRSINGKGPLKDEWRLIKPSFSATKKYVAVKLCRGKDRRRTHWLRIWDEEERKILAEALLSA